MSAVRGWPIATKVHSGNDLHRKQRPDKALQKYISKFYRSDGKAMEVDLANMTNRGIIFLFIRTLYNKDLRRGLAGAKIINTLSDTFN